MSLSKITILFLLLNAIAHATSYRILGLFIHSGKSHVDSFVPIMDRLVERGHDVTVLSYYKYPNANYTELFIEGVPKEFYLDKVTLDKLVPSRSPYAIIEEFFEIRYWADPICDYALNSPSIDNVLRIHKDNPFDLIVVEHFNADCIFGIVHQMNVPFVSLSSCALYPWHYDNYGLPGFPSYIPTHPSGYSKNMGFYERVINWIVHQSYNKLYRLRQIADNQVVGKKFGPGIPDVAEIAKKSSLLMVHQHYSLHGVKPLTPSVVEIGGSHIKAAKPLPDNLKTFIDESEHGVIVISWGSVISAHSLPVEKLNAILQAIGKLRQRVIWKWENDNLPNQPQNLLIQKWLPQRDLICYPGVKAFWAHGGNLGSNEAAHCGVPIIITPFYGDQFLNANAFADRKMGLVLPYADISEERILQAFQEILKPSYFKNGKLVSYSYRNRPVSAADNAAWWIEHISATGDTLLRTNVGELSWFVYYSVDVLLFLSVSVLILILIGFSLISYCCCNKNKGHVKKIKKKKQ